MANGQFHRQVGSAAGVAFAIGRFEGVTVGQLLLEGLGGHVGGRIGGSLPDVFDPPTSPRHRSLAHGIVPIGVATKWIAANILSIQSQCRTISEKFSALAQDCAGQVKQLFYIALAAFFRFLAGAAAGVIAGYLSHLALDICTPAGLPLIA